MGSYRSVGHRRNHLPQNFLTDVTRRKYTGQIRFCCLSCINISIWRKLYRVCYKRCIGDISNCNKNAIASNFACFAGLFIFHTNPGHVSVRQNCFHYRIPNKFYILAGLERL